MIIWLELHLLTYKHAIRDPSVSVFGYQPLVTQKALRVTATQKVVTHA